MLAGLGVFFPFLKCDGVLGVVHVGGAFGAAVDGEEACFLKKPVILVDTMLNTQDYDAAYLTNNLQAGAEAVKKMVELMKKTGVSEENNVTVAVHVSNLSSRTESERLDSIVANWYGIAPRKWKIDSKYMINFGDTNIGEKLVLDNLSTKQNLKVIFAMNNNCTNVTMQAVMKLGRKDVAVMGFDRSDVVKEGIENKEIKKGDGSKELSLF